LDIGLKRFFWYSWDNHLTGLTEADDKILKTPVKAYAQTYDWLVGAQMTACSLTEDGKWISELNREKAIRLGSSGIPVESFLSTFPTTGRQRGRLI
jgi:hypothetical protein